MRILHVCHDYWPAVGGSELLLKEVSERLVAWEEEVSVFTSNAASTEAFVNPAVSLLPPGREIIGGVPVRRFPISRRLRRPFNLVMQASWRLRTPFNDLVRTAWNGPICPRMIGEIARAKPDLIAATAFPFQTMYYPFAARLFHACPIVLIPCFHPDDPWSFDRPIMEKAMRAADAIVALTEYERDHLLSMGISGEKVHVLGAGTDPEHFQGIDRSVFRAGHGMDKADPVIAFIGRMEPEKGVDTLLEAMPRVWRVAPRARLVLAGPATHFSSVVSAKIAALSPEDQQKILCLGLITEEEKRDLLGACDLLALPSRVESFGIVFLEAWACGKPVIGCRTGAVSSVIADEDDGLLVSYGDAEELAAAITRLVSNETMRRDMGKRGKAKVLSRYTWSQIAQSMRALYRELIDARKQAIGLSRRAGVAAPANTTQREDTQGPLVSVLIVSYNSRPDLSECLGSLQQSTYPNIEIIVADNGSTDGGVEFVRRTFPSVKVVELGKNLGFAEATNRAMRVAHGRYLFQLNPDTRIGPRCVEALVRAMQSDEKIGVAAAKMKIYFEPDVLNSAGIAANKILYGWDRGAFELDRGQYDDPAEVIAGCGGALMVCRSLVERIGELDGRFFMYYEDLDFGIRTWLSGARVVYVPHAVVYHKYKAATRAPRYNEYYDHRNRLRTMLKNFSLSTLAWMVPASLSLNLTAIGKYVAAGRHRDALYQLEAILWNLAVLPSTLRERRRVQRLRAVPDARILGLLEEGKSYPRLAAAVPAPGVAYEHTLPVDQLDPFVEMGKNDHRQLGLGWHPRERCGDRVVRWTSDYGIAFLDNPTGDLEEKKIEIEFYCPVRSGLMVRLNDQPLGDCESEPGKWQTRQFDLKEAGRPLKLMILPKEPFIPARQNGGADSRLLGVAVSSIRIIGAQGTWWGRENEGGQRFFGSGRPAGGVTMERSEILKRINAIEWYHVIEVAPGIHTPGRYSPKAFLSAMGFPEDFTGKTVLDIGAYDGFFTFEAEKRGAKRVLALDRHPADFKGFALARELLNSRAEYTIGSVYDLSPETHGIFDVVLFLGVLYHLRHPLLALEKIHSVCRELLLVESHVLDEAFIQERKRMPLEKMHSWLTSSPIMQFYPTNELNNDFSNWWAPNAECLRLMLETSGFRAELAGRWGDRASFRAYRLEFSPPAAWY